MTRTFDPAARRIAVEVSLVGPLRTVEVVLALDTAASRTVIRPHYLILAGYDPGSAERRRRLRAVTGSASGTEITLMSLTALDHTRSNFPIIAHDLPPAVTVDGLLGLDFVRGLVLTLDFARGQIDLAAPRRWRRPWS